jgi:hypothetical protein
MIRKCLFAWLSMVTFVAMSERTALGQPSVDQQLDDPRQPVLADTYRLRYKFRPGETVSYHVEHLATVDTTIQGNRQRVKSRSVSTKVWRIQESSDQSTKFAHGIDDVDMWSEVTGRQAVRYSSKTDQEVPPEYEHVARTVGTPLSIVTIDRSGKVLQRHDQVQQINFGVGGLVVPLPSKPVAIGAKWSVPAELRVSTRDGASKLVKTRQQYELTAVKTGVATIQLTTQVLTPVNSAQIRSQLMQKMTSGQIKFDIDAGRVLSKEIEWDEVVIGFNGADSNMKYLAKFTERLIDDRVASNK